MRVSVKSNIKEFSKDLKRFKDIDVPKITYITLNETAKRTKQLEQTAMKKYLDRPKPQTLNALFIKYARKTKPVVTLTFREWADEFMRFAVFGGVRKVNNTGIPIKANKRLNQFGNIPGRRSGLVKGKNEFIATIKGHTGVWKRTGKGKNAKLKLLINFYSNPKYEKIFPFHRIAKKAVNIHLPLKFKKVADYYVRKAGYKTR
jgi:hypothetical protein